MQLPAIFQQPPPRVCVCCRGAHVRPYPQPLGNDGKLPLLSSNADTFHAANAHRGTTVRDCYFVNAGEDLLLGQPFLHSLSVLLG